MVRELIDLAKTAEDERVRSVCLIAVLDRAGVRPIDYDPKADEDQQRPPFDPKLFSTEELRRMHAMFLLIAERQGLVPPGTAETI